jgi:hypothetical protein
MPTRIGYTDQQLLDYSEYHLLYELQIFRWVVENLPPGKGFPLSAQLESFAIHLRNLTDFFFTLPEKARPDDLVAADFFDSPSAWNPGAIPDLLDDARERANKEISHITYKRKTGTDPTNPWPVQELFEKVHSVAQKFAVGASSKKLHHDVITWLKADAKTATALMISASTSAGNSCVPQGPGGASLSGRNTL